MDNDPPPAGTQPRLIDSSINLIEISDADRKRKILITDSDKCTMAFKKWREKGESFRVDRYRCIEGRCLHQIMSAKTKVTKTKNALKQETYNLSDLKHDL